MGSEVMRNDGAAPVVPRLFRAQAPFYLHCDLHWVRTAHYGTTGSCTPEKSRVRDVLAPSRIAALTTGGLFTP